jgi:xylan 1,4-beta-xylosidase
VRAGVRGGPDINVIATRKGKEKGKDKNGDNDRDREIEILVWNYHDDDVSFPVASIDLAVSGLPANARRALVEDFRVDSSHSNAFGVWKEMGSPQKPSENEYKRLESAGQLQLMDSPTWTTVRDGSVRLQFSLPRQGLSLFRLTW